MVTLRFAPPVIVLMIFTMLAAFSFFTVSSAVAQESSLHNLPLPRWATLASKEVNLRTGPGKRYPIDWVLKNKNMPVEIIQEFEHWRRVREPAGADGWVHRSMLASTRYAMINGKQELFANPDDASRVVAQLDKKVLVRLDSCSGSWCRVSIETFRGWVPRKMLWGVYDTETLKD